MAQNAQALLDSQDMPFMAWKAKATDYLAKAGVKEADMPAKKEGLVELLEIQAAEEAPKAAAEPKAPTNGVEVNLKKKYAPYYLMGEDGEWTAQGNNPQTVPAGLTYLRQDEAEKVLQRKQAEPTENTFAQMKR